MRIKLAAMVLACVVGSPAQAVEVSKVCSGNLETEAGKVTSTGVSYPITYEISGRHARVNFSGKILDVNVEYGLDWKGPWLNKMDDSGYFSFHPEDGGVIKLGITDAIWFSGNC